MSRPLISALVPTRNEERNLAECLASLAFADEIVVVDSESTDRTVEIARAHGARVLVRRFDDWSSQKNWALAQLAHPWALCVDADERVDPALAAAIAALPADPPADGYRLARHNWFLGRRIHHSGWQGDAVLRLFRRDVARFEGAIHEQVVGCARVATLPGALLHHPYRTWGDYERKLWRYARANARMAYDAGRRSGPLAMLVRPPVRFLRMYVAQGGFLDGGAGLALCGLSAVAVFVKYALLWDASSRGPGVLADEEARVILAYVGGFDPGYPRNAVLRVGLNRLGIEVKNCFVAPSGGVIGRGLEILRVIGAMHPRPDVVLVAEFCHKDVPAAWLAARRVGALCAADPLISRLDTMVGDWGIYGPRSLDGWACRRWDEIAFGWPRVVVADTAAHARRYGAMVGKPPLPVVYVGAADEFFDVPDETPPVVPMRVLYVGGFLPLHGVGVIIDAAEQLAAAGGSDIVFDLVGDGIEIHAMRARAAQAGLPNVVFHGRRPLGELAQRMAGAHVVLGVFQRDGEGERVIPNKVVQGLAAGRCVVTAASEASCELLVHDENAVLVPPGDPGALARALAALAADPARRLRLALAGRAMARTTLSPEATARQLLIALGARLEREPAGALPQRRLRPEPSMAPAAPAGA